MIEFREMIAMLHFARTMSTFGPDFEDKLSQQSWHKGLKDLPLDHLKQAFNALTGNREFPTLNEIKDFCKQINNEAAMLPEVAFDLLWRKIGAVGGLNKPELPNEIGLAVERLGGWVFICNNWTDDKKTWHEKSFREAYLNLTEAKAKGLLTQTSKYAPPALQPAQPKQIPGKITEALRMAVSASQPSKPKLKMFLKELKSKQRK